MRNGRFWVTVACGALAGAAPAALAQRQVAAPVTDPGDAKFITEQTRKMGGVMPPEQLALTFEHLDLATKVYPDQKRIESVATLTLTSSRPVPVLILDMYPKFAIAAITVDGRKIAPSAYTNPQGQLRITLPEPIPAGKSFVARVDFSGTPPLAKRPPWEGGTTWMRTPDGKYPWIDTSLWGGGCDLLYPCLDHPTLKPAITDLHYTVPAGLMAPGNGKLVSKVDKNGWTTWNWHARSINTYGSEIGRAQV